MRGAKAHATRYNNTPTHNPDPQNISPKEAEKAFLRSTAFRDPNRPYMVTIGSAYALGGYTCYTITVSYRDEYGTARDMYRDVQFIRYSKSDVRVANPNRF